MKIGEVLKTTIHNIIEKAQPGNNWPTKGGFSQRDNRIRPQGTCNFTAAANCLDYLEIDILSKYKELWPGYTQPEDILSAISELPEAHKEFKKHYSQFDPKKSEIRPRHFSIMIAWVVNKAVGHNVASWKVRSFYDIIHAVENKKPVEISGSFTASGHFIAIKGISPDHSFFWVDDSWGDFYTGYKNKNGHNLKYLANDIKKLCFKGLHAVPSIVFEVKNEKKQ